MAVSNIAADSRQGAATPTPAPVATNGSGQLGDADMFMTLLMAQIKNQNPLEPTDPAQFMTQLVQMNQMQTSLSMLSELKGNTLMLRELQGMALGGQIGREALVASEEIRLSGNKLSGQVMLGNAESAVTLVLTGDNGLPVRIALGAQPAGKAGFSIDPAAHGLAPGRYRVAVETASKAPAPAEFSALIEGVRLPVGGGEPMLTLTGLGDFPASSITQLSGAKPA
ncbi:flagellar hook capping FlgD N-terminal domain-containing protein [Craterilacuibacter sp.]|uniref:flagellar hook capping FlgD N-terminal domain-containing protein n=1 Tax=Craterilacuibacter sp. TaxID=2870909 RepID=UPI003F34020D